MIRTIKNLIYRLNPPKMVKYWKWGEMRQAKVVKQADGSVGMQIVGEDEVYPGFPRGHVLNGSVGRVKKAIKNMIFNQVYAELEKMASDSKYDMLPAEKMVPAVRELHRVLDDLENAEVVPDMKARIRLIKKVITFFLQEDDAYRFRMQWVLERLDMKKMKLSDADKYYFRGKYFKVDHDKFDY